MKVGWRRKDGRKIEILCLMGIKRNVVSVLDALLCVWQSLKEMWCLYRMLYCVFGSH